MSNEKLKIPFNQVVSILSPYVRNKLLEQVKAISIVVLYMVFFQILFLNIPIYHALVVAIGIGFVALGLTFFLEGLLLGIMPLGEFCGQKLLQNSALPFVLFFGFLLGIVATFAEPSLGVLRVSASTIKVWDSPLLFLLLNKYSDWLKVAIGIGVGFAVIIGIFRFIYGFSLKPFLYIIIPILIVISVVCFFDKRLFGIIGLAWDCGGVTTGAVTVPIILALGLGIVKVAGGANSGAASGFGVITLASATPIMAVLVLGFIVLGHSPLPMSEKEFFDASNIETTKTLFSSDKAMEEYVKKNCTPETINRLATDGIIHIDANDSSASAEDGNPLSLGNFYKNIKIALQAVIPLTLVLFFIIFIFLREKIGDFDVVVLGVVFSIIGFTFLNFGVEIGLTSLGSSVGKSLPSSFQKVELDSSKKIITNFDENVVQKAINDKGETEEFFYVKHKNRYLELSYNVENLNEETKTYTYIPSKGPMFDNMVLGILVVFIFAFFLGYCATLAEPSLSAVAIRLEEISVGTFKKNMLVSAVGVGVGVGIALGLLKIIFFIPLIYLLAPAYLIILVLTFLSSDENFVNIAWDTGGATTGPITVPLVISLGLGLGLKVGNSDSFGVLSMASACPIISVLIVGLYASHKQKQVLSDTTQEVT